MRVVTDTGNFVALQIEMPVAGPSAFACGSDGKNVLCATRGQTAYLSPVIGDLSESSAYKALSRAAQGLLDTVGVTPSTVACDLHPDYVSTRFAEKTARERGGLRIEHIQHHHAHVAAIMAEQGISEKVIGVALDGMGLGDDGAVWGGEFLVADLSHYDRKGHFKKYKMPGGDIATLNPERMAFSYLMEEMGCDIDTARRLLPGLSEEAAEVLARMLRGNIRTIETSSAGRLFDAVSAMLGICCHSSFPGEAAIKLEQSCADGATRRYEYRTAGGILDFGPMIRQIAADVGDGVDKREIAAMFHNTVAAGVVEMCGRIAESETLDRVVLSGGVFFNKRLRGLVAEALRSRHLRIAECQRITPGDSGISLGQAAVAVARDKVKG